MKKMKSEQAVLPNPCLEEEEEILYVFSISLMNVTCPTAMILLHSIFLIIFCHFTLFSIVSLFLSLRTIEVLGFDSRQGLGIFLFTTASRTALEPNQPPI
jgi:hypothetical protein